LKTAEKKRKTRIDALILERGLAESMQRAQALLMAGVVSVAGVKVDKPGKEVDSDSEIEIREGLPFVGRGGLKLEGMLEETGFDPAGLNVIDIGSSTGGFTDCLLKRGAARVWAVDVGKGILDYRLRNDERVVVLEERNIRHLDPAEIGAPLDMAVIDVSFISLEKVLPKTRELLKEGGVVFALIKPQFEVGKGQVGKGGIVRDPEKHREVVERIRDFAASIGFTPVATGESPIKGTKGNREFWIFMTLP